MTPALNDLTKYQDIYIPSNIAGIDTKELREQEYWRDAENDVIQMMQSGTSTDPNSFSQSNIQNLVSSVSNSFNTPICDDKCQKERQKLNLVSQLMILDETKKKTPDMIQKLEQEYYEITEDDDEYRKFKKNRVTNEVEENTYKLKDFHSSSYNNLMVDLNNYTAQHNYLDNIGKLKQTYSDLNQNLNKKNNDLVNVKNTSFRKAEYEQGYSENYIRVNNYLYKFYWGLIIFFIINFIFINKKYSDGRLWTIAIILIAIPFTITYIHKFANYALQKVMPYIGFY